ncbi:ABC transporter ATP-binding protein [Salinactinospora qingdaonensis]|uniref:ABC transporter ATP-binding protein n=1 Tax=Salinactinospora qingdaonensis TaxID=702744 RepID=A0ABP7F0P9_9ACTN
MTNASPAPTPPVTPPPVVSVRDLRITFPTLEGPLTAVDGLSFELSPGGALGIVGESGSGKSAASLALMGLHRATNATVTGDITVAGVDVSRADDATVRAMRGNDIAMVFQDPMSALHPQYTIGNQIVEAYRTHRRSASAAQARQRAIDVLDRVGIPHPATRINAYPHEFSGGMKQRVLIAMGLVCEPKVLLADEPTTALDVTVQAQILDLLEDLRTDTGMALILVSHDLGVVAGSTEDIIVMREGCEVESGDVRQVLKSPEHPYTRDLLDAVPRLDLSRQERLARLRTERSRARESGTGSAHVTPAPHPSPRGPVDAEPLVRVENLRRRFRVRGGLFGRASHFYAVDGVSLQVHRGESLGIVGESGSGKSTLSRMITRLLPPTDGRIIFDGHDITHSSERALRPLRRDMQIIFQNPYSSLNPRRTVGDIVGAGLRVQGNRDSRAVKRQVKELLERVGLEPDHYDRFPHAFSGGQRQRIAIARALILNPKLVICDEPVSALDVSTQEQVLRLLAELQDDLDLTLIFVAHDLAVVRQVSDRVVVMRQGRVVESGDGDAVYDTPEHPYTRQLLAAVPVLDPEEAHERRVERQRLREAVGDEGVAS